MMPIRSIYLPVLFICGLLIATGTEVLAQKSNSIIKPAAVQQPLYSEYHGVHIGMSAKEVWEKLGEPAFKAEDQDIFTISEKETAQIAYDPARKVKVISVDYFGGIGAPDYKAVVGPGIETKADGSVYKLVRYEASGFWVSYNRTVGPVVIVTVTIQKM